MGAPLSDSLEARARGLFRISQVAYKVAKEWFKIAHFGRTTFAIPPHWAKDLIVLGLPYEAIDLYVDKVDLGQYLFAKGCNALAKIIKRWQPSIDEENNENID